MRCCFTPSIFANTCFTITWQGIFLCLLKTYILLISIHWFQKYKEVGIIKRKEKHSTRDCTTAAVACSAATVLSPLWRGSPLFPWGEPPLFFIWSGCKSGPECPPLQVTKRVYDPRQTKGIFSSWWGTMTPEQKPDSPLRRGPGARLSSVCHLEPQSCPDSIPSQGFWLFTQGNLDSANKPRVLLILYFIA